MSGDEILRTFPLSLLAIACFVCAVTARAQQAPNASETGIYSSYTGSAAGASSQSGLYPSAASGVSPDAAHGVASQTSLAMSNRAMANSANANLSGMMKYRSTWVAGATSAGEASANRWTGGESSSKATGGASWVAGAKSFGLERQAAGIWSVAPLYGFPSGAASQGSTLSSLSSLAPNSRRFTEGLTPKGAALVKGAGLSSSFASRRGTGYGFRGSMVRPYRAQRGFGSIKSPFTSHARTSSIGSGIGVNSTKRAPVSGTLTSPSLNDTLPENKRLGLHDTLNSGTIDSTSGSSH